MEHNLLDAARRFADANIDAHGIAITPFPGLVVLREVSPTALQYAVSKPLVALVLQGSKRVMMGKEIFDFGAGESLLITTDVPTTSQITKASADAPYYSLVLELDRRLIESLAAEVAAEPFTSGLPVHVDPTDSEVSDAALRLLRLVDRPASLPVLKSQFLRELHYWLLSGVMAAPYAR